MIRSPGRPAPDPVLAARWTVRAPRVGDAEAWHDLQQGIYREGAAFVGDGAPSAGALAAKLRTLRGADALVRFAAADDGGGDPRTGALVGWIEVQRMTPRRLRHVAWLTVAVAPPWRRRGVGAALMAAAFDWAAAEGLRKLQLHVRSGNRGAIALYQRLGYEVEGVLRDQVAVDGPAGSYEDEWVMALRLGGSVARS